MMTLACLHKLLLGVLYENVSCIVSSLLAVHFCSITSLRLSDNQFLQMFTSYSLHNSLKDHHKYHNVVNNVFVFA
jgi:hypothetical protein